MCIRDRQHAVGLQIVFDVLAWPLVLLFELDHPAEEVQAQHRGLTALPGEDNLIPVLSFDVLLDVRFEDLVGDAKLTIASQQLLLVQVIAIGTVQVADGADGLNHRVVGACSTRWHGPRRQIRNRYIVLHASGVLRSILSSFDGLLLSRTGARPRNRAALMRPRLPSGLRCWHAEAVLVHHVLHRGYKVIYGRIIRRKPDLEPRRILDQLFHVKLHSGPHGRNHRDVPDTDVYVFLRVGIEVDHDYPASVRHNRPAEPADITFLEQSVLDLGGEDVLELIYAHG